MVFGIDAPYYTGLRQNTESNEIERIFSEMFILSRNTRLCLRREAWIMYERALSTLLVIKHEHILCELTVGRPQWKQNIERVSSIGQVFDQISRPIPLIVEICFRTLQYWIRTLYSRCTSSQDFTVAKRQLYLEFLETIETDSCVLSYRFHIAIKQTSYNVRLFLKRFPIRNTTLIAAKSSREKIEWRW